MARRPGGGGRVAGVRRPSSAWARVGPALTWVQSGTGAAFSSPLAAVAAKAGVEAGEQSHAVEEADAAFAGGVLDFAPVGEDLAELRAIHFDPFAAQGDEAGVGAEELFPFGVGEGFAVEALLDFEGEEGAGVEGGFFRRVNGDADGGARAFAAAPPVGQLHDDAAFLEGVAFLEEAEGLGRGHGQGLEEAACLEPLADERGAGGGGGARVRGGR